MLDVCDDYGVDGDVCLFAACMLDVCDDVMTMVSTVGVWREEGGRCERGCDAAGKKTRTPLCMWGKTHHT